LTLKAKAFKLKEHPGWCAHFPSEVFLMRRQFLARVALAAGLAAAFLGRCPAHAQKNVDRVKIDTYDGVELHGSFYPGKNGPKSTCVILLHNVGGNSPGNSQEDGWDRLATALQDKGFAVLTFDFRGHGNSTAVHRDTFWKVPQNTAGVKGGPKSDTITVKDFQRGYHPVLVNDIAAAKAYLDRRNDGGECNSHSLILIGAQEGAVIGTMWLATELHRYQLLSLLPVKLDLTPEGKYVNACVWLSMTGTQTSWPSLTEWLKAIGSKNRVPMGFLYGDKDSAAASFAQKWAKELKGSTMPTKKYTAAEAIPKVNLAGHKLLRKDLKTIEQIVDYCSGVMSDITPADPGKVEFDRKGYAWSFGAGRPIIAKRPEERLLGLIPLSSIGVSVR
jgi:pimeloyl-ACP methyl ester carboxylesterase